MESVDKDEFSAEAESYLSAVCENVMRDVAIQHSIVSFDTISYFFQKMTREALVFIYRWPKIEDWQLIFKVSWGFLISKRTYLS